MSSGQAVAHATQPIDGDNEEETRSIAAVDMSRSVSTLNGVSAVGPVQSKQGTIIFPGEGTQESPFVVDWEPGDPENPFNWSKAKKWPLTFVVSAVHLLQHFYEADSKSLCTQVGGRDPMCIVRKQFVHWRNYIHVGGSSNVP